MNLTDVKAMMFDIDGTLVNIKREMSKNLYEALKKLKENGYKLAINTGRPWLGAQKVVDMSYPAKDLFDYYFAYNGAELFDNINKKTTLLGKIDSEYIKELALYFKTEHISLAVYDKTNTYMLFNHFIDNMEAVNYWTSLRFVKPELCDFSKNTYSPPKCLILFEPEYYDELVEMVRKLNSDKVDILRSGEHCLEVIPKGVSKASAVERYAEIIGVDKKQILCFGDAESDVSALQCGLGVFVGNSLDPKEYGIEYQCGSVYEDGIVKFVKENGFID